LGACQPEKAKSHIDVGKACVSPADDDSSVFHSCSPAELSTTGELSIVVDFGLCLSSSCDTLRRATCEATREGSVISVTARADVVSDNSGGCTDDCGSASARCDLGALPEGTYELRYGEASALVEVPSMTSARCAGSTFGRRCCDDASDCGGEACQDNFCR
jgi:hypothetical protein